MEIINRAVYTKKGYGRGFSVVLDDYEIGFEADNQVYEWIDGTYRECPWLSGTDILINPALVGRE